MPVQVANFALDCYYFWGRNIHLGSFHPAFYNVGWDGQEIWHHSHRAPAGPPNPNAWLEYY